MEDKYISVDYRDLRGDLSCYSAVILFRKKKGDKRVMICTRNLNTVLSLSGYGMEGLLYGYDKRHTESTNTLAVVDLAINDVRTIPVDRILGIVLVGYLESNNCEQAFAYYSQVEAMIRQEQEQQKLQERLQAEQLG